MTTENHNSIRLIVKSILFLLALFIIIGVIHELAHLAAAKAMGVTVASFTWFDPHYLAPTLVTAGKESELELAVVGCAGGFVAGVLLIGILTLKRRWFRASFFRWLAGLWMFALGLSQLSEGFLEGFANEIYLANSLDLFSWASFVMLAGGLIGSAIYMALCPEGLHREGFSLSKNIDLFRASPTQYSTPVLRLHLEHAAENVIMLHRGFDTGNQPPSAQSSQTRRHNTHRNDLSVN